MNPLDITLFVWIFLLGLAVGSFLNVCIHRIPARGMSIVRPRSHCFSCGALIRWTDNLPLLSWVWLRARCRWCGAPISARYPLVELLTGAVFLFQARFWLWNGTWSTDGELWARAAAGTVLFCGLLVASAVDLDRRIIPDEISIPGIFIGPLFALFAPAHAPAPFPVAGEPHLDALFHAVLGVAVGGGSVFLIGWVFKLLLKKETMGFGDVKLLAACGGFLGWEGVLLAFLVGCVVGAASGIPYYFLSRNRYIPFGPSLAAGAMAVFWFGPFVRRFLLETWPAFLEGLLGLPPV